MSAPSPVIFTRTRVGRFFKSHIHSQTHRAKHVGEKVDDTSVE
jgi:hypothetical protein